MAHPAVVSGTKRRSGIPTWPAGSDTKVLASGSSRAVNTVRSPRLLSRRSQRATTAPPFLGSLVSTCLRPSQYAMSEPTRLPAVAIATAAGKLIQP